MLIMINFYQSIPKSLYESAQLDGATYMQIFVKITVPLSKACVATIALYNAVSQWNAWMDTAYYTTSESLKNKLCNRYHLGSDRIVRADADGPDHAFFF